MMKIILIALFSAFSFSKAFTQSIEEQAQDRISVLQNQIDKAENLEVDCYKEKMTIRTAEVFLKYANWDEQNIAKNTEYFEQVPIYKDSAKQMAELLPGFIRSEVVTMLDSAIGYLDLLINEKYIREPAPVIDWSKVTHDGDQLTVNGQPVFLADYTWKPHIDELTEFFGNMDGVSIGQNMVVDSTGKINADLLSNVKNKPDGSMGFIFLSNKSVPQWAEDDYGPGFRMREEVFTYTGYDIDNPGALEINGMLFGGLAPFMAGKKYTELGYILCNEPHFYTIKSGNILNWGSGPVSHYTKEKFRDWLTVKHHSINQLNSLWGNDFSSFDEVAIDIPIDESLRGTPKWYDWITFNNYRVVQWYSALKDSVRKYDPEAKIHLKIMPNLWTNNKRGHGIDMEALTEISEIIGNDAGADNAPIRGGQFDWQEKYDFDWRELYMGYDFYSSVSPDKINFNSEAHFLSTVRSRNLYQKPIFARATFWAATTLGMNASLIWYWARRADGSIKIHESSYGYAGSCNQQPRIVNEVASTMMDLNTFSEEITAMQRQRKPVRFFYSETSATNKPNHMDELFEVYESMNFNGVPLGFATKNIIKKQDNTKWDVVVVYKTHYVTTDELAALQNYLDGGGTIIMDDVSLKYDEYKQSHSGLEQSNGRLIKLNTINSIKSKVLDLLENKGSLPSVNVIENNENDFPGCSWKCIANEAGNQVLSIINLGNSNAQLEINLKGAMHGITCKDLLKGITISNRPVLKPGEVLFIEVTDSTATGIEKKKYGNLPADIEIYPNPANHSFKVNLRQTCKEVKMSISNVNGQVLSTTIYQDVQYINYNLSNYSPGFYVVKIATEKSLKNFKLMKQYS